MRYFCVVYIFLKMYLFKLYRLYSSVFNILPFLFYLSHFLFYYNWNMFAKSKIHCFTSLRKYNVCQYQDTVFHITRDNSVLYRYGNNSVPHHCGRYSVPYPYNVSHQCGDAVFLHQYCLVEIWKAILKDSELPRSDWQMYRDTVFKMFSFPEFPPHFLKFPSCFLMMFYIIIMCILQIPRHVA